MSRAKTDLPPRGNRNPDPITNESGAHPIETGVGAAVGGAGVGFAAGMAGGPVGAAIGTVAGAVAGGFAGKAVGEKIDPTIEDQWVNEYYQSIPASSRKGRTVEDYRAAYHHGLTARLQNESVPFETVEDNLQREWDARDGTGTLNWNQARSAVCHAYNRDISKCC